MVLYFFFFLERKNSRGVCVSAKRSVSTDPPSPPTPPSSSLNVNHTTTNLAKGGARERVRETISFFPFPLLFLLLPLIERRAYILYQYL